MKNKSILTLLFIIIIINIISLIYIYNQNKEPRSSIQSIQSVHPTQDEWLKVYLSYNIYKITDLWAQRVSITVDIFTIDENSKPLVPKEIVVGVTSANGEKMLNEDAKQQYIRIIRTISESILKDYKIENDYKLTVQSLF